MLRYTGRKSKAKFSEEKELPCDHVKGVKAPSGAES